MLGLILLVTGACTEPPLTLDQAKALALAAPNIQASVRLNNARPVFEWVDEGKEGWRFTINSDTPCAAGAQACSKLLGHYVVVRATGEVIDLDGNGGDGQSVSSAEIKRLRAAMRAKGCGPNSS